MEKEIMMSIVSTFYKNTEKILYWNDDVVVIESLVRNAYSPS